LRAEWVVADLPRLFDAEPAHARGLARAGHLTERERLAKARQGPLDLRLHRLEPETETLEDGRRDTLAVANQTEEDVLRSDEIVAKAAGFFPGENDDPSCTFGESFKHWPSPTPSPGP